MHHYNFIILSSYNSHYILSTLITELFMNRNTIHYTEVNYNTFCCIPYSANILLQIYDTKFL